MKGLVIAGTHSGCGKTTITLGILAALKKKGLTVQSFKTGPDFIDGGLHRLITGRASRNLDLWMCGEEYVKECFAKYSADADISVIEGVMGMYDGKLSTASLATVLDLPVILIVDAYGMAESAGAVVQGFRDYKAEARKRESAEGKDLQAYELASLRAEISGVIFNRVASENHFNRLKDSVRDVPVLGYLPRDLNFEIPHRHLGLTVAEESPLSEEAIQKLADVVLKYVDVDALVGKSARTQERKPESAQARKEKPSGLPGSRACELKIAVASDKAFCFYYEDNLDLLREAGAEIVLFSPLADDKIPDDVGAVYIGGGYPELYAEQLSRNGTMLRSVKDFADSGMPVYAECGGFMYLTEGIYDFDGVFHPMAGVFPLKTKMMKKRARLGYREAALKLNSLLSRKGDVIRGHEFHYSEVVKDRSQNTDDDSIPLLVKGGQGGVTAIYSVKDGSGNSLPDEGYQVKNTLGSYIHIHFGSNSMIAEKFIGFIKKVYSSGCHSRKPRTSRDRLRASGILPGKDSGQAGMTENSSITEYK